MRSDKLPLDKSNFSPVKEEKNTPCAVKIKWKLFKFEKDTEELLDRLERIQSELMKAYLLK